MIDEIQGGLIVIYVVNRSIGPRGLFPIVSAVNWTIVLFSCFSTGWQMPLLFFFFFKLTILFFLFKE